MAKSADPQIVQEIRRLASDPARVHVFLRAAQWDMMAQGLTIADVCDKIIEYIDAGERVKPTALRDIPELAGTPAYEMKPRIHDILFYIKVTLLEIGGPGERMLLISVHPDH
jgi:hypothetical protein